jgi:glycosyltransferase involved in cell wall biosynthesis
MRRYTGLLAGWGGLAVYRLAQALREAVVASCRPESSNIAVLCDSHLRYGSAQAIGLTEVGYNVTLYYVDRLDEFGGSRVDRSRFLSRAEAAGVAVVPLPRRRLRMLPVHTASLVRDLRRRRVALAVVQAHIDPRYALLGLALPTALVLHDPQVHSGDTESTFPPPVRAVSRVAELTASCLVIHSFRLIGQLRPLLQRLPIAVVPHGADMAPEPSSIPRERQLLVFGRLMEYKGIRTALEAFRASREKSGETALIVAGRGPLAHLARGELNVELREEYIADADVEDLLHRTRLVLLPYSDATQSGVGLQAVSRGIPCIVSSAGALPDLLPRGLADFVVPPNDPERLATAIVTHIDHDASLRRAVFDHAQAHFAWPIVAARLASEFRRLGVVDAL